MGWDPAPEPVLDAFRAGHDIEFQIASRFGAMKVTGIQAPNPKTGEMYPLPENVDLEAFGDVLMDMVAHTAGHSFAGAATADGVGRLAYSPCYQQADDPHFGLSFRIIEDKTGKQAHHESSFSIPFESERPETSRLVRLLEEAKRSNPDALKWHESEGPGELEFRLYDAPNGRSTISPDSPFSSIDLRRVVAEHYAEMGVNEPERIACSAAWSPDTDPAGHDGNLDGGGVVVQLGTERTPSMVSTWARVRYARHQTIHQTTAPARWDLTDFEKIGQDRFAAILDVYLSGSELQPIIPEVILSGDRLPPGYKSITERRSERSAAMLEAARNSQQHASCDPAQPAPPSGRAVRP
ncbi:MULTISPECIES: hypothetical protein [unclassified Thioalkalivibrio]|uniref:hypothetical protein n=1 Tax=unclassified Thioalkalivibrio TaxID=2621013 RepID=UPI0003797858|nr:MULTISPECIES: hypothetical protein [unclassified Thioalkalivibrio]